jgi:hypothetical protein
VDTSTTLLMTLPRISRRARSPPPTLQAPGRSIGTASRSIGTPSHRMGTHGRRRTRRSTPWWRSYSATPPLTTMQRTPGYIVTKRKRLRRILRVVAKTRPCLPVRTRGMHAGIWSLPRPRAAPHPPPTSSTDERLVSYTYCTKFSGREYPPTAAMLLYEASKSTDVR